MMRRPISECRQPWESIVVDPLGGVQPCCFASHQVGSLKENTVEEIWNGVRMVRLRGAIRDGFVDAVCRNASCAFVRETERLYGFDSYDCRCEPNVVIATNESCRTGFCVSGWSCPEDWGIWTNNRDALLVLVLPGAPATDLTLELHCRGVGHANDPCRKVRVEVNGRESVCWDFHYPDETEASRWRAIDISADLVTTRRLEIGFRIENPVCPQSWGAQDGRQVGFGLSAIKVTTAPDTASERGSHSASRHARAGYAAMRQLFRRSRQ